jgi:hypothetical protein
MYIRAIHTYFEFSIPSCYRHNEVYSSDVVCLPQKAHLPHTPGGTRGIEEVEAPASIQNLRVYKDRTFITERNKSSVSAVIPDGSSVSHALQVFASQGT